MTIQPIRVFGDPVLTSPAVAVTDFDKELRRLVDDLAETMMEAPGVGLAAPQIGVPLRVFTYYYEEEIGHLINPVLSLSEDTEVDEEGCLSVPGLTYPTERALGVVARGMNMHGEPVTIEGTALLARIMQHETDHLDGIVFVDRLTPELRRDAMRQIRQSEWFDLGTPGEEGAPMPSYPIIRLSPHPMRPGLAH